MKVNKKKRAKAIMHLTSIAYVIDNDRREDLIPLLLQHLETYYNSKLITTEEYTKTKFNVERKINNA